MGEWPFSNVKGYITLLFKIRMRNNFENKKVRKSGITAASKRIDAGRRQHPAKLRGASADDENTSCQQ